MTNRYRLKLSDIRSAYLNHMPHNRTFVRFLKENMVFKEYFRNTHNAVSNSGLGTFTITPFEFIREAINYAFGWEKPEWVSLHEKWSQQVHRMDKNKLTNELKKAEKTIRKYV